MINAGGGDNVEKIKKTDGINRPLELHKSIKQEKPNKSFFGPFCEIAWYKSTFYWLHEMAACCYFGADLGNRLDDNFPSRLTGGLLTPLTPAFGISVCGFRWRPPVLKQEQILKCTTLTRFLERELT